MKCRRILVIEPDRFLQKMLNDELKRRNFEARFVVDGRAALDDLVVNSRPNIILLELNLPKPGMNGWEFLSLQKGTPSIADIPTLVYSEGSAALKTLPPRYIQKRPDFTELMESLERICAETEASETSATGGEKPSDDPSPEFDLFHQR